MFESLRNMAGLAGVMKDLPRIKARFEAAKKRLAELTISAETGGGAVRATASGALRIVSIEIDQPLMAGLIDSQDPDDRSMAEDLIAGAVNAALEKARELAAREMASAAEELGIPIPAGGLSGLLE